MTNKIRIKLKTYDHILLDKSVAEIVRNTRGTGAKIIGPHMLIKNQENSLK